MVLSPKRGRRRNGASSREGDLTLKGTATVEVFKIMASLSLLPGPAWGLNKELQRDVKVAVKIIVRTEMPAAVFRALLTTRTVKHLIVHGAMPRVHVMPNTIGALELHGVRGRVKDMPQHLHSLTLVLPQGLGSAHAAAYLGMLPETVRSLALDASQCHANLTDLTLPARLQTLRLTRLRELPALPASLTSITLESCSLEAIVQLPPSVTEACLSDTSCRVGQFTRTSIGVEGTNLCRLRLTELQPTWAVQPVPQGLTDLHIQWHFKSDRWGRDISVALSVLPQSLEALTLSSGHARLTLTLGALPHSLKTLDATGVATFNSALGLLPESLTCLSLGESFDQALGALPAALTELRIRNGTSWRTCYFNQSLGALPPSLRVLDLHQCHRFNHPLGRLPRALWQLRLGDAFNQPLLQQPALLPAVQGQQAAAPASALNAGLAADPLQRAPDAPARLPDTLAVLHLGEAFDHPLGPLPEGLAELRVGSFGRDGCFSHALGPLPAALRILDLTTRAACDHALGGLPDALRELRLGGAFDQPLPQLPARLEVLALGDAFDAALPAALPRALRELRVGDRFNAPLPLPPRLEVLIIGASYTHRLDLAALPLKELHVGRKYVHVLPLLPGTRVTRAHWRDT